MQILVYTLNLETEIALKKNNTFLFVSDSFEWSAAAINEKRINVMMATPTMLKYDFRTVLRQKK